MVKEKVRYLPPEDAIKLNSAAKTTKQTMCSKLSSTDRRDMLTTIYKRTHSAVKTSGSRSVAWKENASSGTKQRAVQMSNSSGGPNNHPDFPIQSTRGSLKNTLGAEDRPTKHVSPSVSSKSSPHLKKWNDGRERVRFTLNRKEETSQSFSRGLKNTDAVEGRHGKQVFPSRDRKSSPHTVMPRKSNNSGFFSSSKSEKQNDGYERVDLSLNHKEEMMSNSQVGEIFHPGSPTARSVSGSLKSKHVIEDRHGKQISPPPLKSKEWNDGVGRVGWTEAPKMKLICNDDPVDVILPTKEVRASSSRIEHPINSSASSMPLKPMPISNSVACPINRESQKRKSQNALYDPLKYPQNEPALEIVWKGAFEVLNLSHEMGFCKGFLAHLSAKVSAKAHKFSKQLPGVLQFKLHSRSELWPELFQFRSPDWNDIALYFYPERNERSKKKYSDLLHYMVKKDLMLRSRIGHVELLGFASKTLALDCQEMKGSYFMWGVFRRLKGNTRK